MYGLTNKENEVFMYLCQGMSTLDIARNMEVKSSTVYKHKQNIFKKCDVKSTIELLKKTGKIRM